MPTGRNKDKIIAGNQTMKYTHHDEIVLRYVSSNDNLVKFLQYL